ncbi:mannose-1-phosphate guanylyltransferase/mannose-6-phosphate isomerase [Shewanella dokdonensis]|uniref:mannose-1-phosphate guanylyltransferase/mannose-6-phosphate isomerase n=1 Tax=Shewanella dokdonensis TaxID=712036 RepID=UPI00200CF458|nr:mannose-1-phosphate guanylyltransferase/mannose-6-phosphate isomerase [Shewanella dokdonensis]MCL1073888.1 mannose-1-phosphate guanylyltransferase/mannose-6-phosphate isomerase [Shewanella dokdonensis]
MLLPVIMAGGSGSRLWPLSRQLFPKQFLTLNGSLSMLQTTTKRLKHIEHQPPLVICNQEHRFSVAEQLRLTGSQHSGILLEPIGKNTAPAIALAAFYSLKKGYDPVMLVLAADHVIKNEQAFCNTVMQAIGSAEAGKLVTFGIVPTSAETGYGYIKRGKAVGDNSVFEVAQFVEKPDYETAENYLASGQFYWNSGMFLIKASRYLDELKRFSAEIYNACAIAVNETNEDLDFIRINSEAFSKCPEDSIDYAVMEKTEDAVVVPMDCQWSDVGSWAALWEISDKDSSGNACKGDVISINCSNSYFHTQEKMIAAIGLDDIVIVDTKDATLVAKKSDVQLVKKVVEQLKAEGRSQWKHHREVYRPWGKYDSVDSGERFQVKRITVKPGAKLSVQMHHHRAEHWVVVCGTAKVTIDGKDQYLTENESVYIPITAVHALENPGKVPLELIEVQSGSYLGEDDIVRFEDKYGRA